MLNQGPEFSKRPRANFIFKDLQVRNILLNTIKKLTSFKDELPEPKILR